MTSRAIRSVPVAAVLLSAIFVVPAVVAHMGGGFVFNQWAPIGLAWCCALFVGLIAASWRGAGVAIPSSAAWTGLVAACAFCAWSAATVIPADDQYAAHLEVARTAFYVIAMLTALLLARDVHTITAATVVWLVSVAVIAVSITAALVGSADVLFEQGRLVGPFAYPNAVAVFLVLPVPLALSIAAHRGTRPELRALLAAGATLATMLAVLAQSRGALVSLAVGMIVTVAFAGRRSRVVSVCIVWGVAIGAAWTRLQSAYRVLRIAPDHAPFILGHRVVPTIVVASIAVAITMLVVSLLDERYRLTGSRRHIARIGIWGAVAIVGPALVLHLGLLDSTRNRSAARSDAGRLVVSSDESIGARRDLWAVAWRDVRDHPVVGVGPANFEATIYRYRSRAFARTPRQAHQLTLEVLAERGIVGAALLATVLGAITWSSLRARRRIAGDRQLVLLTGLVGSCSVWIVHVQLDWTWQITAATLPAVLGAGCLLGAARWAEAAPERGERSRGRSHVPIVLTLVVCAAGAGLLVPAIAAERSLRDARRALESAHAHQAATAAARASSWAPHSAEAWLLRARSSRLLNEPELEGQQLERARAVARDTWSIHAEASAYYHRTGQEQLAQEAAADVRRLNPRFSTQRDDRSRTKSGR